MTVRVLAAIVLVLAGCQIDVRSDGYRCSIAADCSDGRMCIDGWCVTSGNADADTGDAPDADPNCPAVCTNCDGGACNILCDAAASCPAQIVCPPGRVCNVTCGGDLSCQGGIDCTMAIACDIECTNMRACVGTLTSGTGPFNLVCSGARSCDAIIDCFNACKCDVTCAGSNACAMDEICPLEPAPTCGSMDSCVSTMAAECDVCP